MVDAWKKLKEKCKAKRTKTALPETTRRPKGEEFIVQRVSAHVTGDQGLSCKSVGQIRNLKPTSVHGIIEYLHQKRKIEEAHNSRQTLAGHTKETVQMHSLARNFAQQLESQADRNGDLALFGEQSFNSISTSTYGTTEFYESTAHAQTTYMEERPAEPELEIQESDLEINVRPQRARRRPAYLKDFADK
eukprot:gene13385-14757_t